MLAGVFAKIPFAVALVVFPAGTPSWLKSTVLTVELLMIVLPLVCPSFPSVVEPLLKVFPHTAN